MKLPVNLFTVMFAVPRTCGWLAHWLEAFEDSEQKLMRPRQIYDGSEERDFVSIGAR
jgi:citrate synthase